MVMKDEQPNIGRGDKTVIRAIASNAQPADIDIQFGRIFNQQDTVGRQFTVGSSVVRYGLQIVLLQILPQVRSMTSIQSLVRLLP